MAAGRECFVLGAEQNSFRYQSKVQIQRLGNTYLDTSIWTLNLDTHTQLRKGRK